MVKPKPLVLNDREIELLEKDVNDGSISASKLTEEIKRRIKSAIRFYFKYRDFPNILPKKYRTEEVEEFEKRIESADTDEYASKIVEEYNDWLLKFAFKDIYKEVSKDG